ncbi:MAG: phosphodiester glycosidase family protein, partial [Cyanobacteria bacterium J06560_2]
MPQDKRRHQLKKFCWVLSLPVVLSACSPASLVSPDMRKAEAVTPQVAQSRTQVSPVDYSTYELPQATVHVVQVDPKQDVSLSVAVADELETVDMIARQQNALAAINAGFFDPQNGKTTSHLVSQGSVVGDPADNERLVENPSLQQYLPSILNRSEFRRYHCEEGDRYAIATHAAPIPTTCDLDSAVGAGPQLLPVDTSAEEAFTDYENGELTRDAIGSLQPNARSAVGILADGKIVLLMTAQREDAPGFTLADMTDFAQTLG